MPTNCVLYWCPILEKKIPCLLAANEIYKVKTIFDMRIYVHCKWDFTKFTEYNVTRAEVMKYSNEMVLLNYVYPAHTQAQKDYADLCIPNKIPDVNTYRDDELDRFETLVGMLINVDGDISKEMFFDLCEFISYELLFELCEFDDRVFMQTLSMSKLTEQPSNVLVPQMIRMTRDVFNKYNSPKFPIPEAPVYKIFNYRHWSEIDYIPFPILINIDNLDYNCNYITGL